MLGNPFLNLDRIIHLELLNKATTFPYPPEDYYLKISRTFCTDGDRIFKNIDSIKVDSSTQGEALWQVQAYQEKIDYLMGTMGIIMNKLEFTIDDPVSHGSWHAVMMEIIVYLKDMMDSLVFRHPGLFDLELDISDLMKLIFVKTNSEKIHEALKLLPEDSARYKAFKLLLLPLEEPIDCFRYYHLFYFKDLIKEATDILQKKAQDEEQAIMILDLLWKLDFNHPAFINLHRRKFADFLGTSQGKDRVKTCLELRKDLRLNKTRNCSHLYQGAPTLFAELENWLSTEINCTRALMAVESIIAVNPFADFKVKTTLSQKELAGMLRIFSEQGIFLHEDRRELIRFFANYFIPSSGKHFTLAALTRSYDQHKGDSVLRQLKYLIDPKDRRS